MGPVEVVPNSANLSRTSNPSQPAPRHDSDPGSSSTGEALAYLVDGLADAILLIDESWRITYANQMARRISRIKPENLNRETLWELYPETLGTDLEQAYREVLCTRTPRDIEAFYYEPFKTWFGVRILPMQRGLAVHYRDITSIREAEAARDDAAEQAQQVLEATTDAVVCLDRDWRITYLNQNANKILAPSGELLHTKVWESFPQAVYKDSPFVVHYYRAMNEGIPAEFEAFYPEPLNIWVYVLVRPAKDGIILFFRDITGQKQASAALIQTEKLAAVGRLASSIAHEINNPLEAVTNLLYLVRLHSHIPEVQSYLDTAEQELRRVSNIANQTLRFHRQASRPQAISCVGLLSTVLNIYEGKLRNANITVEKRKRANQPIVCFEGDIRQVLNNLVANAIDAMPTGGRLLVRSREATDWTSGRKGLVITIADTGTGIAPETQASLFQAFFTTKGISGTGLGLWISADIVDRHHGRLRVRSSQRQHHTGTVITLFLPFETSLETHSPNRLSSIAV